MPHGGLRYLRDMFDFGEVNSLTIGRRANQGVYLTNEEREEVLLPNEYIEDDWEIGDSVEVFVYLDSEDRPVATTELPHLTLHGFAPLEAKAVNQIGAFFDWGLKKDLFVPYSEHLKPIHEGSTHVVYLYFDEKTNRLVGSTKVAKFLNEETPEYEPGDEVHLLVYDKTDLGYPVIVDRSYHGLLFSNETFESLEVGSTKYGYVKQVRNDHKIDVTLYRFGYGKVDDQAEAILKALGEADGVMALTDKSEPERIYQTFGISKKVFKKAIGQLYKKRYISIEKQGIRLTEGGIRYAEEVTAQHNGD